MIPDVAQNNREIPRGRVLIAECGDLTDSDPRAEIEHLDRRSAWGAATGRPVMARLVARYAGWAIAGSCMRWDNGAFGVIWETNGTRGGRWFKSHDEARAFFDRLPE